MGVLALPRPIPVSPHRPSAGTVSLRFPDRTDTGARPNRPERDTTGHTGRAWLGEIYRGCRCLPHAYAWEFLIEFVKTWGVHG